MCPLPCYSTRSFGPLLAAWCWDNTKGWVRADMNQESCRLHKLKGQPSCPWDACCKGDHRLGFLAWLSLCFPLPSSGLGCALLVIPHRGNLRASPKGCSSQQFSRENDSPRASTTISHQLQAEPGVAPSRCPVQNVQQLLTHCLVYNRLLLLGPCATHHSRKNRRIWFPINSCNIPGSLKNMEPYRHNSQKVCFLSDLMLLCFYTEHSQKRPCWPPSHSPGVLLMHALLWESFPDNSVTLST